MHFDYYNCANIFNKDNNFYFNIFSFFNIKFEY